MFCAGKGGNGRKIDVINSDKRHTICSSTFKGMDINI